MGVYIKDMKMPKEGEWISVNIFHDGKCFVQSWCGMDFNFAAKLTAVPVPPHGRLIDTDAVSLEGGPYEYDEWCKWALGQYQDAPTVIPSSSD